MGILDGLTTGSPATSSGTTNSTTTMPAWYQDLSRGIAAQGVNNAARPYTQYTGQRVAGFTPEHSGALSAINRQQGAWNAPLVGGINAYSNLPGQVAPTYRGAADAAMNASNNLGPAQTWPDHVQKYMSPYTMQVVDEIGRVGRRGLEESLPILNQSFVGAGGFGSRRNSEALAKQMREANADITGLQGQALERGYGTSANIFGQDANRVQQQGQLQANTAIQGANTALNAAQGWGNTVDTSARGMGALSQMGVGNDTTDINRLIMAGDRQQQHRQRELDVNYGDFQEARDWNQNQLTQLTNMLKGYQMPSSTTSTSTSANTPAGVAPLQWLGALLGLTQTGGSAPTGGP